MRLNEIASNRPATLLEALQRQSQKVHPREYELPDEASQAPEGEGFHDWRNYGLKLKGVKEVADVLERIRYSKLPVLVYADPDVDGFISTYFWVELLKEWGINHSWYINPGREHGFLLDIDKVAGKYNVVNGDFTISQEQIEYLVERGSCVISMDHHDVPDLNEVLVVNGAGGKSKGVYINNQYPFEPEEFRYLSGAQVVLYTLRWALREMGIEEDGSKLFSRTFTALGAITLLSDIRDINNPEAHKELEVLYNHVFTGEFRRLYMGVMEGKVDYGYGVPRFDRSFIDYTFTPSVNSLIRLGREYEGLEFILGAPYPKGRITPQKEQKEFVRKLVDDVSISDFGKLRFIRIDKSKYPPKDRLIISNFLGMVCSQLMKEGHSVLGYVVGTDGVIERASFRGQKTGVPYRSTLEDLIDARGHEIAFGVKNFQPTPEVLKEIVIRVNTLEKSVPEVLDVIELDEEGIKDSKLLERIAIHNAYSTSDKLRYVRYIGDFKVALLETEKITKWSLNGVDVVQFDMLLDIGRDLILPSMDRKDVVLVLSKKSPNGKRKTRV